MTDVNQQLLYIQEQIKSLGQSPEITELRGLDVRADCMVWRIYDEKMYGFIGEVTKAGNSWRTLSYSSGENISHHSMKSLKEAVTYLKWRDKCRCRWRPIWDYVGNCDCGARAEVLR